MVVVVAEKPDRADCLAWSWFAGWLCCFFFSFLLSFFRSVFFPSSLGASKLMAAAAAAAASAAAEEYVCLTGKLMSVYLFVASSGLP